MSAWHATSVSRAVLLAATALAWVSEVHASAQTDAGIDDSGPVSDGPGSGCSSGDAQMDGQAARFVDVSDWPSPTNAVQLIYSHQYDRLIVKNTASAVSVVNASTGASTPPHLANYQFTDMSLSPDQRYVFVADYGGENIGYGTPANQSYVHRVDFLDGSWSVRKAVIAGNVQATSSDSLILKSIDQWVTFTNNAWGTGDTLVQLSTNNSSFPGYYATVYYGNFRYDARTARLLHGNSGSSSREVQAFKIQNNEFVKQEGTGTYGSANNYGGSVALATDGSAFYYGRLSVDALDVSHTLLVFPEIIYAATGDIAFGENNYYDAHSGATLGTLGFAATAYGLNPNGSDFWVYDVGANLLRHFVAVLPCPGDASTTNDGGADAFSDAASDAAPNDTSSPDAAPDATPALDVAPDGTPADTGTPDTHADALGGDATNAPDAQRDASTDARRNDASSSLDVTIADGSLIPDTSSMDATITVDAATDIRAPMDVVSSRDGASSSDAASTDVDAGTQGGDEGRGCGCSITSPRRATTGLFAFATLLGLAVGRRGRRKCLARATRGMMGRNR